jgi:hypothetical protein
MEIVISNMTGQAVRELDLGSYSPGTHRVAIDGRGLAPGVYSYSVRINGASYPGKMIVK